MKKIIVLLSIVVMIACNDTRNRTADPNSTDSTARIDNTMKNDNSGDTASYSRMPDKITDTTPKKDTTRY